MIIEKQILNHAEQEIKEIEKVIDIAEKIYGYGLNRIPIKLLCDGVNRRRELIECLKYKNNYANRIDKEIIKMNFPNNIISEDLNGRIHLVFKFINNYGVSVLQLPYTNDAEVAIIYFSDIKHYNVTHNTNLGKGVFTSIHTNEEIIAIIKMVKSL